MATLNYESHMMSLTATEVARKSQRPYRYGMILLCVGALINWLGLAENYVEPVRYIGVACIIAGALLICAAMCCWLQRPAPDVTEQITVGENHVHVIEVSNISLPLSSSTQQKPPDYDTVADSPPCYEEAIKLNPSLLLREPKPSSSQERLQQVLVVDTPSTPPPPYEPSR